MSITTDQWTIKSVLTWTQTYFNEKSVENPRLSAELLLADTLALKRIDLYLQYERPLEKQELQSFKQKILRRIHHEPIAYIIGSKAFWESTFDVSPQVLIPRPDTETLVETAISSIQGKTIPLRILEVGVGSGAIIISLAKKFPHHHFFATDRSYPAAFIAQQNAKKILPATTVHFLISDWFSGISMKQPFDMIVSNPPYICTQDLKTLQPDIVNHEPQMALDGGHDGLHHIRQIIQHGESYLKHNAYLIMEIGFDQRNAVEQIISLTGKYDSVKCIKDYAGHERVLIMHKRTSEHGA
ncbi:MAG: peptide chain release factor N(5)-glutamine methyltransferase [Candidatus Magnetomorum sp.]|nr:peptide chain release factor N(5)-glutamine methyltransferase [Candidatus Magnetomorum sp.]